MKLRRMKLVALAMSALMVTSALPMTAFAEEEVFYEEVADEALVGESEDVEVYLEDEENVDFFEMEEDEAVVGEDGEAPEATATDIMFHYDETTKAATVTYKVSGKEFTDPATVIKSGDATCSAKAYVIAKATVLGVDKTSDVIEYGEMKDHNWVEVPDTRYVIRVNDNDCEKGGTVKAQFKCTVGQETEWQEFEVKELAHKEKETKTEYIVSEENNTKLVDGQPTLIDKAKSGTYTVRTYKICEICGKIYDDKSEPKTLAAGEESYVAVYKVSDTVKAGLTVGMKENEIPSDIEEIEMTDCTKDGWYILGHYDKNNDLIAVDDKIAIPAHHYTKGIVDLEFKTAADRSQVKVTYKDGKIDTITNISCYQPITYYEVKHCYHNGCKNNKCKTDKNHENYTCEHTDLKEASRTEKTIAPTGAHVVDKALKKKVADLVKANESAETSGALYDALKALENEKNAKGEKVNYLTLSDLTATCTTPGTVVVNYDCMVCRAAADKETIQLKKLGHKEQAAVRENVVDSTCAKEGSYDAVVRCERCNEVLSSKTGIVIPMKQHTYEKLTAEQLSKAKVLGFEGSVVVGDKITGNFIGTKADNSGVYEDFGVKAITFVVCGNCGKKLTIDPATITVVKKEASQISGKAGSITLKATFGTLAPVEATFPYYTSINTYQGRSDGDSQTTPGEGEHKHTAGEAVVENFVDATCEAAGSYDLVTKCTEDGEVMSSIHVVVAAKGHDFGAWKTTSRATVFAAGKQTRTCALCKKTETKSLAKLPSIIKLNKSAVTVKVGKYATVKVSKWNLKDYIAPTAEGGVKSGNKSVASAFKAGSYLIKVRGIKAGTTNVTVKMKAGATTTFKVTVKK